MLTKPLTWAVHLEKENVVPIFSIDISPDGRCFATGGEDGVVNLWSFAKALNPASPEATFLTEVKSHEQPVNSVRFNSTGRLLASGGSDGIVAVSLKVKENEWKQLRKWHQQKLDVSEVAWGTNERTKLLASCSFDGSIVIWDVERGDAVHVITGHRNMVKGLAWDPLGQFLASQADCEGIFIWRTSDWKCVKQVSEPFEKMVEGSDHLRLSWSPNGMYLTGVQAYSLPQPYVAVLSRDRWNLEFCVVGHKSGVSISKWNPRFFLPRNQGSGERDPKKLAMCLCLGSMDHSFSMWLQTERHPILHMDGFFENRISDVAWSADGYTCLVSSRDGFVALCNFTQDDLGVAASYKVSPLDVFPSTSKMPVADNLQLWMMERNEMPNLKEIDKRSRHDTVDEAIAQASQPKRQKKAAVTEALQSRMCIKSDSVQPPQPSSSTPTKSKPLPLITMQETTHAKDKKHHKASFVHHCGKRKTSSGEWSSVKLVVENGVGEGHCTVMCFKGASEMWRDEIKGKAVAVAGNLNFKAVATDASSLHVYDDVGMQLISALQLPSSAALLISDFDWGLLSVTNCGELSLWNVKEKRLLCRASVCSLCKQSQLSTIRLISDNQPIAVLSDGNSFLYNKGLEAWTLFSDASQSQTGRQAVHAEQEVVDLTVEDLSIHAGATDVRHELEQGIMNAMDMQSPMEYRKWLIAYVQFLISRISHNGSDRNQEETKLRKICTNLLQSGNPELLDMHPVAFLKTYLLPEMMKVRDLQRLTEEICEWINRL